MHFGFQIGTWYDNVETFDRIQIRLLEIESVKSRVHDRGGLGNPRRGDWEKRILNRIEENPGSSTRIFNAIETSSDATVYVFSYTINNGFKNYRRLIFNLENDVFGH